MITVINALTFTTGGVVGALIGYLIEHRLARSRSLEAIQITEFNKSVADFHTAFAPALAQIYIAKKRGRFDVSPAPDVEKFLSDSLLGQATAIEKFRFYVPESQRTK